MSRVLLAGLAAALPGLLAAPAPAPAADQAVSVGDNFYAPSRVAVKPGEAVTWTTSGAGSHNVTFEDGALIDPWPPRPGPWTTSRAFLTEGTYRYVCAVHGSQGMAGFVYVNAAGNVPPVARLTVSPGLAATGTPVTFTGSSSTDPDGTIARYQWDLDGNGDYETDTGLSPSASRTYTAPATLEVWMRVTDDDGVMSEVMRPLRVTHPPAPTFAASPNPVVAGAPVSFDASGSRDPDGRIIGYEWDLDGDGLFEVDSGQTPAASRSYPAAGARSVRLRVTDNEGITRETGRWLRVAPPASIPPVLVNPDEPIPRAPSFAISRKRVRVARSGRFRFRFRAGPRLKGMVGLRSSRAVAGRRGRRVSLGQRRFTVPASGVVTLTWRLSRKNLALLRRRRAIGFRATVRVRTATGRVRSAATTLTLARPRRAEPS